MLELLIKPFDGSSVKGKTQTHSCELFNRYDLYFKHNRTIGELP
tara:strand:+ start:1272 stop:1403 length:132 start_codon:yes stop_codon:yes gene_type:complete